MITSVNAVFAKKNVVYALFELVLLYAQTARGISLRIEVYQDRTCFPSSPKAAPRLIVVVDFPTPPF